MAESILPSDDSPPLKEEKRVVDKTETDIKKDDGSSAHEDETVNKSSVNRNVNFTTRNTDAKTTSTKPASKQRQVEQNRTSLENNAKEIGRDRKRNTKSVVTENVNLEEKHDTAKSKSGKSVFNSHKADKTHNVSRKDGTSLRQGRKDKAYDKINTEGTISDVQTTPHVSRSTAHKNETRDNRVLKQKSDSKPKSYAFRMNHHVTKQREMKPPSSEMALVMGTAKITGNKAKKREDDVENDAEANTKSKADKREDMEATGYKTKDRQSESAPVSFKRDKFYNSRKMNDKTWKQNKNAKTQPLTDDNVDPEGQQTDAKSAPSVRPKSEHKHNSAKDTDVQQSKGKYVKTKPPKNKEKSESNHDRNASRSLKQEKKNKTTYLYLQFNQLMKDKSAIHSFLMQRLRTSQRHIGFEIVEYVKKMDENYAIVTLKFASKHSAHTTKQLLNLSNRYNSLKIFSTFDPSQVDASKIVTKNEAVFKQQLKDILRRAEQIIETHQEKINKTERSLQELKTRKQMSIAEFEMVAPQRFALVDKLKELKLQIAEFRSFLENLTSKLKQYWEDNTYDKYIKEIRTLFGVESCRFKAALPMYAQRKEIIQLVKDNQVCVILGETGSGKSTQVVQYLYQVGFGNDGIIVCTQPRKVAATSLATRVASEMNSSVGQLVGYKAGMKSKFGGNTRILYTTDHALLNDCLQDPSLSKYSCVIIDEAHERSIFTDLLLGMLKQCISRRPELRVIITSATIDPAVFVKYFNGCPVHKVSGRMFPVEVVWKSDGVDEDIFERYQEAAVETAVDIHRNKPDGDVLVFLTTPLETERCRDSLNQKLKNDNSYTCLVLHGQVQMNEQQQVFEPTAKGQRKIVFATNSAETSITIPGIKYVVDTGLVKEKRYDPKRNLDSLNVYMISRSSAEQRKGRAGRTGPGTCYRLYSRELYESMESSSAPEMLRVHLGQAMLKLVELGINPEEYEFVQSPDKSAIAEAVRMLEDIGAVKNKRITETGKLLTKLPMEPRHGMIIAKGKEHSVIYEAIILSAVSSAGNSLFYRGGTQKDKDQADLIKLNFCHYGGDSLTMFNVYRQWDKQPEKKKNAWCFENFINSKVIRGVRETVNEICSVLKKELHLDIKHSIGDSSKTDQDLQKILFECFSSNICHFLGHERAGYYSARLNQLVHMHPSSALKPLGLSPQWIIFEQVLKTSKDFVTGLTPVDESVVNAAVEDGTLSYDIEEMKHKQVYPIYTECVGSRTFWNIVGPGFSKMRTLEEKADALTAPSLAVVEADKEKGEITIFSTDDCSEDLSQLFKSDVDKVRVELEHEDREYSLSDQAESVRVIIGIGGEISQVIMPDDYRTVVIENPPDDTTEDDVLEKFSEYGVIKTCKEFKTWNNKRWGTVTFELAKDAKQAVQATEGDSDMIAVARNRAGAAQHVAFKAKLTWCRRMSRGYAFVDISETALDAYIKLRRESPIRIKGKLTHINPNENNESSLHLRPLAFDADEGDIRSALLEFLDEDDNSEVIEKVTVARNNVETTPDMLDTFKSRIKAEMGKYAPSKDFTVEVVEPRPKAVNYLAFVKFRHPEEGQRACQMVPGRFTIRDMDVKMVPDISAELYIQANVMEFIREDLEDSVKNLSRLADIISLRIKQLKHGNFVVDIHASSTEQMADVRSVLQNIIQGDVLEYKKCPFLKHMFTKNGRKHLEKLQSKFRCLIVVDNRTMTISIKGTSNVKNRVRSSIDDFLTSIEKGKLKEICLKGRDKPGGVMKMLTLRYGIDLEKFRQDTALLAVQMDFRRHKLELRGPAEAIMKAESVIEDITAELTRVLSVQLHQIKRPDCVVCFMPIEEGQLYRLEACGHPYCMDCIKQQLQHSLMNKDFPVSCVQEECRLRFMWKDVSNFITNGSIVAEDLVAATVSAFVTGHHTEYRYCITPNCPIIYRVSSDGSKFQCCECHTDICTSCHVQYHDGLSCAMYNSPDREDTILFNNLMESSDKRKCCPNCDMPVEKVSGCNKTRCYACKKVFCWLCLEVFESGQKCYAHLVKKHGGYI